MVRLNFVPSTVSIPSIKPCSVMIWYHCWPGKIGWRIRWTLYRHGKSDCPRSRSPNILVSILRRLKRSTTPFVWIHWFIGLWIECVTSTKSICFHFYQAILKIELCKSLCHRMIAIAALPAHDTCRPTAFVEIINGIAYNVYVQRLVFRQGKMSATDSL